MTLREFRKEKGISQDRMAKELGITLSMYEKVESGRASASAAFMRRIKNRYPDANIDLLFFSADSNNIAVSASNIPTSRT